MIDEENFQVVSLVQAMLGAITPNFRAVSLELVGGLITLHFLLERDDPEDLEEIDDIAFEFEALQMSRIHLRITVNVSDEEYTKVKPPGRLVYLKKQS